MNRKLLFVASVLVATVVGVAWLAFNKNQKALAEAERLSVASLAGRFYGEVALAKSTPRHSLSNRIADLQKTRQELLSLPLTSACIQEARDALSTAMFSYTYDFTKFLAQEPRSGDLSTADAEFSKSRSQIAECKSTESKN